MMLSSRQLVLGRWLVVVMLANLVGSPRIQQTVMFGETLFYLSNDCGPSNQAIPTPINPWGMTLLEDLIGEGDFDPSGNEDQDNYQDVKGAENMACKQHNSHGSDKWICSLHFTFNTSYVS